jgi:hypothetical protein
LKGAIDGICFSHEEGAMMGEGEGKQWRQCPLRGGERANGEAVERSNAPPFGHEVAATACLGKKKGAGWAKPAERPRPKRTGGGLAIQVD